MKRSATTRRISLAAILIALLPAAAFAVDIGTLHCNDATGVPLNLNTVVTVSGTVTATYPTATSTRLFVQDATGGINVFGTPQFCGALGDLIEVTGTLIHFNGLTEVASTATVPLSLTLVSSGNPLPAPLVLTPAQVNNTYQADNCEPNESILATVPQVYVRTSTGAVPTGNYAANTNYRLISAGADSTTNFCTMRIMSTAGTPCANSVNPIVGQPIIASCAINVTGVIQQFDSATPFNTGYQFTPRVVADLDYPPSCTVGVNAKTWGGVKNLYRD